MTSFDTVDQIRCAVCRLQSRQTMLASSNTFLGQPDLDTRPPEMLRSTIPWWLMECPHCGYTAPDLSAKAPPGAGVMVKSAEYQALDCKFQRHSMLLAGLRHFADAGWVALHAAWMADDRGDDETARNCRGRAIELWKTGKSQGQNFAQSVEQEFALVVDVLRRQGRFAEARETCLEALNEPRLTPTIEDILRLQLSLIDKLDAGRHGMDELPRGPGGAQRVTLA